ncbi:hypothetical protein DE4585_03402 [Mycobacteroides salmoniphilum]|uniref:Uncharacterized protein n=1 Tax=Mycobacteroides salmoniphilum TaxID=404941 RepID=A0A4R8S3T1_9MYCO|nr:hypothetical protein [Mycobacteroides salmoniphilum]TDZ79654.1 hypothetical protein DE4585_03402 [Mycobacteroides salmoniphilum]
MFSNRQIFRDPAVPLTPAQESSARRAARRAARQSRRSLRTARGQYRRYRADAGEPYLDWSRWSAEYLDEYRDSGLINGDGLGGGPDATMGAI